MALHTGRRLLAASTIEGTPVQNQAGEDLGEINELMIDLEKVIIPLSGTANWVISAPRIPEYLNTSYRWRSWRL